MSKDAALALLQGARTLTLRAAISLEPGEMRDRADLAVSALRDAIELGREEIDLARTQHHLEVITDALAAPGTSEAA